MNCFFRMFKLYFVQRLWNDGHLTVYCLFVIPGLRRVVGQLHRQWIGGLDVRGRCGKQVSPVPKLS